MNHQGTGLSRRPGNLALFALLLLAGLATVRSASGQNPPGSYRQSCRNVVVTANGTLTASCKSRSGLWSPTSLVQYNQCMSEIANFDGHLQCSKGAPTPGGSYTQTCRDAFVINGGTLQAACRDRQGRWHTGQISGFGNCRTEIYNFDGNLECGRGTAAPPAGSYQQSCKGISVSGTLLSATCRRISGLFLSTSLANSFACAQINNSDGVLVCEGRR